MIATHLKPDYAERQVARVSVVPLPWDAPKPEQATPIGRKNDTPQISTIAAMPRPLPSPAKETFCAHDEDALSIAMQRLDGVVANRFPPVPNPKQARDYKPGSLAARVRDVIRQDGPSTAQQVADRLGIRLSSATNCLCDQRGNGRATCDPETRMWSLT